MHSTLLRFCLAAACFALLLSAAAPSANAQCGVNTTGFGDLGIVTNNPFHAEVVFTRPDANEVVSTIEPRHPELVARDSQGRVRTERLAGEYLHDNGAEAGTKVVQRIIMICDPVAQTLTQLDTLNATARIMHSRPSAPNSSRANGAPAHTFCSSRLLLNHPGHVPGPEDLGVQTIEGVEAHGVRFNVTMRDASLASGTVTSAASSDHAHEIWCSDELSAIVLTVSQNTKTGAKSTGAMQKIERTEPDPSLFQIPPDYAITESVAEPREGHTTGPVSTLHPVENP
jgi:hypothetical protein